MATLLMKSASASFGVIPIALFQLRKLLLYVATSFFSTFGAAQLLGQSAGAFMNVLRYRARKR